MLIKSRNRRYPFTHQTGMNDCGPACLKMVADYYGQHYSLGFLKGKCGLCHAGASMLGLGNAAESIGFHAQGVKTDLLGLEEIASDAPVILHWNDNHYVVLYKVVASAGLRTYTIADPSVGVVRYNEEDLARSWISHGLAKEYARSGENWRAGRDGPNQFSGNVLMLKPTEAFYKQPLSEGLRKVTVMHWLWRYFTPYRQYFLRLMLLMLISVGVTLAAPYLTRVLVDNGINEHNVGVIYLVLFGQLTLFVSGGLSELLRSRLLLHMGTRINISMVSEFLTKLLRLPIRFFDSHKTGDLLQRIRDHDRVENLLTYSAVYTLFAVLNFVLLSVVLALYSVHIFIVFLFGSLCGFGWMLLFLEKRKGIDYRLFDMYSKEHNNIIETLTGMADIKVSNSMHVKETEWKGIQSELYTQKVRSLAVNQYQQIGATIFRQGTAIFITFLAAMSVVHGDITLGTMFAITMIVGQMISPLERLHELISSLQDARLGIERIQEVLVQKEEYSPDGQSLISTLTSNEHIKLKNITFGYGRHPERAVLKDVSFMIPNGKMTAIVGPSGSGKTTLLKLLLKLYDPWNGTIFFGKTDLKSLNHDAWRKKCGVVMQEGQLFSGSIAYNIALGHVMNEHSVQKAARIAHAEEFILSLPRTYDTYIGPQGTELSSGQKQRILLARAVYRNPSYLFLDEATGFLDANNEKSVMDNLKKYFYGKTVVVIAHRLSTVQCADQLIVMNKGEIVESGTHNELTLKRGMYYTLVKNQLELDG